MSETQAAPARRGRPGRVDRSRILEAAGAMDSATLTMQEVAASLGVSTPALYHYFRNKEELLTALAHEHLRCFEMAPTNGRGWQDWMRDCCLGTYDLLAADPEVAKHTRIAEPSAGRMVLMDTVLAELLRAGFTPLSARRVYDLMLRFLFRAAVQTDSNIGRLLKMRPDLVDDCKDLPALALVLSAHLPDETPRTAFECELDCMIAGIEHSFGPGRH